MEILSYLLLSIWFKSPPPSLLNKVFAAIFRLPKEVLNSASSLVQRLHMELYNPGQGVEGGQWTWVFHPEERGRGREPLGSRHKYSPIIK